MSTPITVGKAVLVPFIVRLSDGNPDATTVATASSGDTSKIHAAINPSNPRELGVLAVAVFGADVTVNILCGGKVAQLAFRPTAPVVTGIEPGTPGGEIDPPSWLT